MKSNYSYQIIVLWIAFLLTLLFHTDLGLMPLFHGQSIAHSHDTQDISWVLWLMLLFFVPPLCAIILPTFTNSKRYRIGHFWLTIIYSFLNFAHLVADLSVTQIAWYQIALMTILCIIGILLNFVSYRWMTHYRRANTSNVELDPELR
jgi:ABC-type spermidine/putrescine transport system permease subunit II